MFFDYHNLRNEFNARGFVIIPQLFDLEKVDRLKKICEIILSQWRDEYLKSHPKFNKKNCDIFTKSKYIFNNFCQLNFLLNIIASEQILSILNCICDRQLLFEGAVYFFNPEESSWRGDWHRDGQVIARDETTEKSRIFNSSFIRVHLALINDDNLEFITGSHARWDTPQELEIRIGLNGKLSNSNEMPSVTKINLNPGDAVFFD